MKIIISFFLLICIDSHSQWAPITHSGNTYMKNGNDSIIYSNIMLFSSCWGKMWGDISNQADLQAALGLKSNTESPIFTGTVALPTTTMTGLMTNYNGINTVSNGIPSIIANINATAQGANIATATLYAVPSAGFYRISIYIAVTRAATTSSTMPSTTITYVDGNSGSNSHSTTTTATSSGNSVTTTFAQTTYVLYAKASTNIQYATGGFASSGGTSMQYALRIRVEAL